MKYLNRPSLFALIFMPFLFACKSLDSGLRSSRASTSVVNPQDVLKDDINSNTFQDGNVSIIARKGTIAASIQNALRFDDPSCTSQEREEIVSWFKDYAMTLAVLFKGQLSFHNTHLQQLVDDARMKINAQNGLQN